MTKTSLAFALTIAAVSGSLACGSIGSSDEQPATHQEAVTATYGGPHLLWRNLHTGALSAWVLNGTQVIGTQDFSSGVSADAGSDPGAVETGSTILWKYPGGRLFDWKFDNRGTVTSTDLVSWDCTDSCAEAWRPVGRTRYSIPCTVAPGGLGCPIGDGIMWHNAGTGELGFWKLSGTTVTDKQMLSWSCGPGCANDWRAVLTADFNGDGDTDLLWYNRKTGGLSAWLLKNGAVTGVKDLKGTCDEASGCAGTWSIVDATDVNADGIVDLTWFNKSNGQVSSWLLARDGSTTGYPVLSRTCPAASGCSADWFPLGYITFPQQIR